jgi:hypothetical protein
MNGKRLSAGVIPSVFEWVDPEKRERPNPLERARRAVHEEFHASDISDSEDEDMDTTPEPSTSTSSIESTPSLSEPSQAHPLIDDLQAQIVRQAL